ncbi:MAG: tRNA (adenosine(37)-N6)-threonylcarbamoyltransferase complex ATPase subunit type 1 TsaE [Flavobacteriaceae bacterium]|nr:tRNA (adenosine(37)-N6)-threonylcarbamoyltransferase complex ATPase subunit type 1 TsaE [Flavobacteriaceae bacterium]
MNQTYTLTEVDAVANEIIRLAKNKVLLFYGGMGAGKTTLIKAIAKNLGVDDVTSSPTFSLVNEYKTRSGEVIYHFDFYRIESEAEAYSFGAEEYLDSGNWCFIEWPEKVENLLPLDACIIHLGVKSNNRRTIQMQ